MLSLYSYYSLLHSVPTRRSSDLQGAADLTDGLVDIRLGEAAMAAQPLERGRDAIGEVVEHEALPLGRMDPTSLVRGSDRKSTRLNSSHVAISYAVFCLKKTIRS